MSQIKIKRALAASGIGRHPGSASAMLDALPASVIKALTSAQLALMLDAMWAACQDAKSLARKNDISEGVIWDASQRRLREIAA